MATISNQAQSRININPEIQTAQQAAKQLQIDPTVVEKAMAQLGADIVKALGPAYADYFRAMQDGLHALTDRSRESDIKALPAQPQAPEVVRDTMLSMDTSKLPPFEGRLPEDFFQNIDQWVKNKTIPFELGQALKNLACGPKEGTIQPNLSLSQASSQQGKDKGTSDQQQGQQRSQEEWDVIEKTGIKGGNRLSISAAPSGAKGGNTPSASPTGNGYNFVENETDVLNAYIPKDSVYRGSFETLIKFDDQMRNIAFYSMDELKRIKAAKSGLISELENLDPIKDAGKIATIQNKISLLADDDRTVYDRLNRAQKANDERKELLKSIREIFGHAISAIANNTGKS